jgi:hypothetical protein
LEELKMIVVMLKMNNGVKHYFGADRLSNVWEKETKAHLLTLAISKAVYIGYNENDIVSVEIIAD